MKKTWIVLANASRARILEREVTEGPLAEVADLVHPQSRQKGSALTADREGHAQKAHGDRGHASTAFQPVTDPRQKEHAVFASEVATYLDEAVTTGLCQVVVLIASDPFLGEVKRHLSDAVRHALRASIPLDLTSFVEPDLSHRVVYALDQARQ